MELEGLCDLISLLLSVRKHIHAVAMTQLTHITDISEGKVVIEASLAGPVSDTFSWSLWTLCLCVEGNRAVFIVVLLSDSIHDLLLHYLGFFLVDLLFWFKHVFWLTLSIFNALSFLTSVALFSSLEVVVLALVTLPAAFWELETALLKILTKTFVALIILTILEILCGLPVVVALLRMVLSWGLIVVDINVIDRLWDEWLNVLLGWLINLLLRIKWLWAKDSLSWEQRRRATTWWIFKARMSICWIPILASVIVQAVHILNLIIYWTLLLAIKIHILCIHDVLQWWSFIKWTFNKFIFFLFWS